MISTNSSCLSILKVMKKYRRYLPSFDALVFFEAAARHQSFTRSAGELYVTQAAVSKRIRELESRLGIQLFQRQGRTIHLTQPGRRFQQRITMALEYIEDACREVSDDYEEPVRIVANSAVSLFWLSPRLKEFGLSDNSCHVNLITSDRVSDHTNLENDLVITYGFSETPGWNSDFLFEERLLPVASPGYFEERELPAPLELNDMVNIAPAITLLEYDRMAPDWINWRVWIEKTGAHGLKACRLKQCQSYAHAIGEALKGKGLALGSTALIDAEILNGLLYTIGQEALLSGRSYYVSYPQRKQLSEGAHRLRNWLLKNKPANK